MWCGFFYSVAASKYNVVDICSNVARRTHIIIVSSYNVVESINSGVDSSNGVKSNSGVE